MKRHDFNFKESPLVRSKTTNPFKKTGDLRQIDDKHFEETNSGRKIIHYKSKFKKKKKLIKVNIITIVPLQSMILMLCLLSTHNT